MYHIYQSISSFHMNRSSTNQGASLQPGTKTSVVDFISLACSNNWRTVSHFSRANCAEHSNDKREEVWRIAADLQRSDYQRSVTYQRRWPSETRGSERKCASYLLPRSLSGVNQEPKLSTECIVVMTCSKSSFSSVIWGNRIYGQKEH